jgi:PAS domain S-box-containing protein
MIRQNETVVGSRGPIWWLGEFPDTIKGTMASSRSDAANRALRELRHAVERIQVEGGSSDRVLRKRAEALIARLGNAPVAMLVADNRGRYVDVNAAAVSLTGYSRTELLHRSVWDLTPISQQGRGRALWRAFLAREQMSGTYPVRRKSGRVVKARYFAAANVLPGLHVSALATPPLLRRLRRRYALSRTRRSD